MNYDNYDQKEGSRAHFQRSPGKINCIFESRDQQQQQQHARNDQMYSKTEMWTLYEPNEVCDLELYSKT